MAAAKPPNSTGDQSDQTSAKSHRDASPVRHDPSLPGAPAEQWFFRIDGREFGPSSRDQLVHFLTPPRLCTSLEVMCTEREGHWFLIGKNETIEMVLEKVGISLEPIAETNSSSITRVALSESFGLLRGLSRTTFDGVAKHSVLISVVFAFLSINGAVFYLTRDPATRERQILARFESLLEAALALNTKDHSADEWREFADEAEKELEPLINELARSASPKHPVRQELLFAGRDYLKKLFRDGKPPSHSLEAMMANRYLQLARDHLQQGDASR